jgi:hypothetical protein
VVSGWWLVVGGAVSNPNAVIWIRPQSINASLHL